MKEQIDKLREKAPITASVIEEAIELLKTLSSICPNCDSNIPPNEICPKCGYDSLRRKKE